MAATQKKIERTRGLRALRGRLYTGSQAIVRAKVPGAATSELHPGTQ